MDNRITRMLSVDYSIVQARMDWIARAQLAAAVSNAGGLGIIEDILAGFSATVAGLGQPTPGTTANP